MEKINIKHLAAELNLSISTVSRALHDSHEISTATKERVLALAKKLAYVPNHHASGLRKNISKTIAVVIPEVADSYFAQAINGIESVAQANGYHVLIYLTHESFAKEKAILKDFQGGRVDGVLMSITSETVESKHIEELVDNGMPLVFFDRVCEEIETAKITTNDYESGYVATEHLIKNGCQKIVILTVSKSLSICGERRKGYEQALKDNGIFFDETNIIACSNQEVDNLELIQNLLSQPDRPDGIMAIVEKLTNCVYLACTNLKLNIPQDIKIISFSNLPSAAILNPPLTTVTQPAFEMGKTAAALLFKALTKKNFNLKIERVVIPSVLHYRKSTAPE